MSRLRKAMERGQTHPQIGGLSTGSTVQGSNKESSVFVHLQSLIIDPGIILP